MAQRRSARKGWNQLSSSYRTRLGRAGISQRDYESGKSLSSARGHASTPEKPHLAKRNPVRYQKYMQKHDIPVRAMSKSQRQKYLDMIYDRPNPPRSDVNAHRAMSARAVNRTQPSVLRLDPATRVALAKDLGVQHSVDKYNRMSLDHQVRIADIWLTSYMTHAMAEQEPELSGRRLSIWEEMEDAYGDIYDDFDRGELDWGEFFRNFKQEYLEFFG